MKIFTSEVKFYNKHGEGVVFNNEKPFYVFGVIIGEIIEWVIIEENKTYGNAKLVNVVKKSPNRLEHNIENAEIIGGYELLHMNQEEQKKFKINQVIQDFKKNANIDLKDIEWFSGKKQFKYRNKITLHDGFFYQKKSNKPIEINDFLLSDIEWDKNRKGTIIYRKLDTLISGTKDDKKYTSDTLLGYQFRVGLNSFYQVNKEVTEYAYNYIEKNIIKNTNVLDLYCGIGTIGITISKNAKKVVGIEENFDSFKDALYNKKINNIKNIKFINSTVEKFLQYNEEKIKFDNVILDPPRNGINKEVIKKINNLLKPKIIIYMSCNPSTQAADVSRIKDNYKIKNFIVMDMFPQTYHIETIIVLERIKT